MKRLCSVCLGLWLGGAAVHAGPVEEAIVSIMRLSEEPNYTWVATVSDDARTYDIDGKTTREGYSVVKMPAINSVRRRLGRDISDTRVEAIFRGNVACVLRTEGGWVRPDDLPEPEAISDFDRLAANARSAAIVPPATTAGAIKGAAIRRRVTGQPQEEARRYSNLQLAICPPHEELGVIVSSHRDLTVEEDVVTGMLTDLGAQLLLVRDGQKQITPLKASGSFKIWLRDGNVARYQVVLEGVLSIEAPKSGRVTVVVHQRTMTELSDIGATIVDVPETARLRLAAQ